MLNSPQSSTPHLARNLDTPLLTLAGLGLLGFADAAYLAVGHYLTLPLPCSVAHGCEKVLTSSYAMVGPIPLALFGVVFYLVITGLALWLHTAPVQSPRLVRLLFALTAVGLITSIGFVALQAFVIQAFCMYCLGSAVVSLLLFIVSVWGMFKPANRG